MNTIQLDIEKIDSKIIDGIEFKNCIIILVSIDGRLTQDIDFLRNGLVVLSELSKSKDNPGTYLIFTDPSGIADAGGWAGVEVGHSDDRITWEVKKYPDRLRFEFSKELYLNAISKMLAKVNAIVPTVDVEPTSFFPPESWD